MAYSWTSLRHGPSLGLAFRKSPLSSRSAPSRGHHGGTSPSRSTKVLRSRAAIAAEPRPAVTELTAGAARTPSRPPTRYLLRRVASFAVKFLGCKVSQADAMLARRALLAAGHVEAAEADADLHVINTCCITGEAEAKSRQSVRRSLRDAEQVFVAGCAVNLNARQFGDIDDRVTPFVGHRRRRGRGDGRPGGPGLRRPRPRRARPRAGPRPRRPGRPHPWLRQGPGRLRLPLRLLHHPHRAGLRPLAARERDPGRGGRAGALRPARDGDDRDQRGGLPRPRAGARARRADDGGGPRPRRRARAALQRRGHPRQGHAARGAGHRAEGLPAPPRPHAVRRRRRAARHGPPLLLRRVPGPHRPRARGGAGRQRHHRRDRRLPHRGRGRV